MYGGKAAMMAKKKQAEDQAKLGKEMMQQKTVRLRQIYNDFQSNLTQFAEKYKDQINHDSKFRDKFNNMCQDLGVDPMICTSEAKRSEEEHLHRSRFRGLLPKPCDEDLGHLC